MERLMAVGPGSNTEPIVRLIAEAPSESAAAALCDQAAKVIAGC